MVIPIPLITLPHNPTTNVTPFTYRDGLTYLQRLEQIVKFVNNKVIPYVNSSYGELADEIQNELNTLIEQVDNIVQQIVDSSIELQDPISAELILNNASQTYAAIYSLFEQLIKEDPNDEGTFIVTLPVPINPIENAIEEDPNDPGFFI